MRKRFFILTGQIFLLFAIVFFGPGTSFAMENMPTIRAKSWILMDFSSGAVLEEKNAEMPRPPASMTKMMTALIVRDKIESGELHWEDEVTVTKRASAIEEAQIFLKPGEKETVRELFIAMLVQSANDATVALAEHVAGSEEAFVELMNQKAKELGMEHTHFRNATGLDMRLYPDPPKVAGEHVMSAHDSAILARHLIKTYPDVLEVTKLSTYTFRKGTAREQKVINWNRMLPGLAHYYEGVDGVKTGHTDAAGYCFTGTAQKNDTRFVTVVMGAATEARRFTETAKLLDYGFEHYELTEWVSEGQPIPGAERMDLPNGVERSVGAVAAEPLKLAAKTDEKQKYSIQVKWKSGIKAPIKKGDVLGEARIYFAGEEIKGVEPIRVVAAADVEEASWIRLFFRKIGDEMSSLFE
jgi:D-alanyl-D-alanine carboxypeptidase (penicillin-binding protein 5/6)